MMSDREFTVNVQVNSSGVGRLTWEEQTVDAATLQKAISLAADDALLAHNLRRLTVEIPATDRPARVALHRAGFRQEGRLRQLIPLPNGEYGDVLVYSRLASDVVYGDVGFSSVMDSVLPTKRVIAHAVFVNPSDELLLLETTYKSDWELPGGVVEPGESPRTGAEREIHEELGISVNLGQPAIIDWMPPYLGWSDAIQFLFDGGRLEHQVAAAVRAADREIKAVHWVDAHKVGDFVTELSARRILKILDGETGHTENGR